MLSIVSFVVVIGVLIFVHELGHFVVAKAVGVQVLRFSLGFGRPLLAWRRGETEYWISWVPLGGYVKMAGLEDEGVSGELEGGASSVPVDPARAFDRKPLPARFAVILAGVSMNFLFAVLVYSGLAYAGKLEPDLVTTTQVDTVRVSELPAAAAPLAALRRGERITHVNDDTVRTWTELIGDLLTAESPVRLRIAGRSEPIVLDLPAPSSSDTAVRLGLVRNLTPYVPPVIAAVALASPAARAGLEPGDRLVRVGDDTIVSWSDFARVARASPETALRVTVERRDTLHVVTVTPERRTERDPVTRQDRSFGMIGVSALRPTSSAHTVAGALQMGWNQTMQGLDQIVTFLKRLVLGRASPRELGGPITIAQISGQAARVGINVLLGFMAFLSLNLAVLNLLPIPVLDGGQLVFLLAEGVRRKPLSLALRLRLTQVGFAVIAGLMLFVIGNELLRVLRPLLQRVFN